MRLREATALLMLGITACGEVDLTPLAPQVSSPSASGERSLIASVIPPIEGVEGIEILRGPAASALYGAGGCRMEIRIHTSRISAPDSSSRR